MPVSAMLSSQWKNVGDKVIVVGSPIDKVAADQMWTSAIFSDELVTGEERKTKILQPLNLQRTKKPLSYCSFDSFLYHLTRNTWPYKG